MRVLQQLAGKITSGEYPAGSKLVEEDLSRELGVSRGPLREALLRLEERRLVERRPYSGTRVAPIDRRVLQEVYEIRAELECLSVRRAISRITDAEIEMLKRRAVDRSIPEEEAHEVRGIPIRKSFHLKIAEISGSKELLRFLTDQIWLFSSMSYQLWVQAPEGIIEAQNEHVRIGEAIAWRDAELAGLLMRRHILAGLDRACKLL